jgi:hypothetical protein
MTRYVVGLLLVSSLVLVNAQQRAVLPPIDNGTQEPTLEVFRARLTTIVRARNARALHALIAPDIQITFGEPNGQAAFQAKWHPERRDSSLWTELETILRLGGAFVGEQYCAPYLYAAFPPDIDAFDHAVVIEKDVPLRAAAAANARIVARLSYEIVATKPGARAGRSPWVEVTRQGTASAGYVERRLLRSPADYRACFSLRDGRWMMTALIAGD